MMIKIIIIFNDADGDDDALAIFLWPQEYEFRCYTTQALITIIVSHHQWHRFCFKTKSKPPVLNSSYNLFLKFVLKI